MSKYEEFIDKKFGKLTVIKYVGQSPFNSPLFECKCDCGNITYAKLGDLKCGNKKSCGCLRKEYHYEYKKKIADLEAKLAESEEFTQQYRKECAKIQSENIQLKQQLAEKEKAIENYEKFTSVPLVEMYKMYEQDKIDYAVEQLERVKGKLEERIDIIEENEREGFCDKKQGLDMWQENKSAIKIIDQLITEIKEGINK